MLANSSSKWDGERKDTAKANLPYRVHFPITKEEEG